MNKNRLWPSLILLTAILLSACQTTPTPTFEPTAPPPTAEPTAEPTEPPVEEEPIYLAIIWHQHQPVYYQDPETGVYVKPWVRVHASKDYYDMAAILQDYPDVHVTFNLTPSLIRQLDDFAAGATDMYWEMTMVPADELTDEEKWFLLRYFFDINGRIIERFPRYVELRAMRPGASDADIAAAMENWTAQDYRDLQVLFNLGWTDPDFLAQEPLAALVEKERDFTEEDKAIVMAEHLRILREVIPLHADLQDAGQIEVTMTPFAHPILPLLLDTSLAREALPNVELPANQFRFGQDATAHVELGVDYYSDHFGMDPRGMWPAEGSVSQEIVNIIGQAGIQWMASDEMVLAPSIGLGSFSRNSDDTVQEADALYRPYYVEGGSGIPVAMVFRDHTISDLVGFTYSSLPGDVAAADFVRRVHAIRDQLEAQNAEGPHLVTVILDGENAWEHYPNDGKEFLHSLYQNLSDDPTIATVTPSEYLEMFPEQPAIDDLWAGSWIDGTFSTWIGEEEENLAWDYLFEIRDLLAKYERGVRETDADSLAAAQEMMYIAEGSDWFWWYGADQDSGQDELFDLQFRDTLKDVCRLLGEEPPTFLDVPVIPQRAQPADQPATDLIAPTIDGTVTEGEWDAGGVYAALEGEIFDQMIYGFDAQNLYLRIDTQYPWAALTTCGGNPNCRSNLGVYLLPPGGGDASAFSRYGGAETYLGFGATRLLEMIFGNNAELTGMLYSTFNGETWELSDDFAIEDTEIAVEDTTLEMAIPLSMLPPETGAIDTGDRIQMRVVLSQGTDEAQSDQELMPSTGPAQLVVPDLGLTTQVLEVVDPENDDYGPGNYEYPTDAVFQAGAYDLIGFEVGYDDENIVFKLTVDGPVENSWGAPLGLSIQAFDIYIDQDGPGSGARQLLPARNAALSADYGWDYALWVNGWTPTLYSPGTEGPENTQVTVEVLPDPGQRKVTVKVPRSALGDDPENWSYLAILMSHDGYGPSNIRELEPGATQWQAGGRPEGTNYPRIFDVAWPADGTPTQEEMLSNYALSQDPVDDLGADDFAQLGMVAP
jgi:alpha-amylase/alpha-mannosidase (GH57 family)